MHLSHIVFLLVITRKAAIAGTALAAITATALDALDEEYVPKYFLATSNRPPRTGCSVS